jgi:hypothetical protein
MSSTSYFGLLPGRKTAMNLHRRHFLQFLALLPWVSQAAARSKTEGEQALREGLERSTRNAILQLSRENGYFADAKLKIGLPKKMAKADRILRSLGYEQKVDDLILAMNRAAEMAIGQALEPLLNAIDNLSFTQINEGREDRIVPAFFRLSTEKQLSETMLPIIQSTRQTSGLTQAYSNLANTLARYGIKSELIKVEQYVNTQAINGLYLRIEDQERVNHD